MMYRTHKVKLDPSALQEKYFAQSCGIARFAYNWALAEWIRQRDAGEKPSEMALRRQLNAIKRTEFPWMLDVSKCVPQHAIQNLGLAFRHFFQNIKAGRKPGFPQFKKKGKRDSFRADNAPQDSMSHAVPVVGKSIKLPGCGLVKMREELRFSGRVIAATISRAADGWYVSIRVETDDCLSGPLDKGIVGVDLGVRTLATLSDGVVFKAIKPLENSLRRLSRVNRRFSKKQKGSKNREKAKAKLARLHLRIANERKDLLHKMTTHLAKNYSIIGIEDLNVAGMIKSKLMSRHIVDAGFGEVRRQLEYKSKMTGAKVVVIDRFFPSSKKCSCCGVMHDMNLKDRVMRCECGSIIDRDLNAAINIRRQAMALLSVEEKALADNISSVKPAPVKQKTNRWRKPAERMADFETKLSHEQTR